MNKDSLLVPCVVDPTRVARVESGSEERMNWEVFFFCDDDAHARFVADPLRWCGALTDPVTLERFVPDQRSPHLEHGGHPYYFASAEHRDAFAADPDHYVVVPGYMLGESRHDVEERERKRQEEREAEAAEEARRAAEAGGAAPAAGEPDPGT
jgi:YHS domain-containing protein